MNWICFTPFPHQTKYPLIRDLGALSVGLMEIGEDVRYLRLESGEPISGPPFSTVSEADAIDPAWWRLSKADLVVMMFGRSYLEKYYEAIHTAGKTLVLRMDSMEYISPRHNFWPTAYKKAVYHIDTQRVHRPSYPAVLGYAYGMLFAALASVSPHFSSNLLRRAAYADMILIETGEGCERLRSSFRRLGRDDLAERVEVVAPPVIFQNGFPTTAPLKEHRILAIGNWSRYVKNTPLMVACLCNALEVEPTYSATVVGGGDEIVRGLLARQPETIRSRIKVLGALQRSEINALYAKSQIVFLASRSEGFPNVTAEGAAWGCSTAGWSGIPAFAHFSQLGFGTSAKKNCEEALTGALLSEVSAWKSGSRDPQTISNWARCQFPASKVAMSLRSLIQKRLPLFAHHSESLQ